MQCNPRLGRLTRLAWHRHLTYAFRTRHREARCRAISLRKKSSQAPFNARQTDFTVHRHPQGLHLCLLLGRPVYRKRQLKGAWRQVFPAWRLVAARPVLQSHGISPRRTLWRPSAAPNATTVRHQRVPVHHHTERGQHPHGKTARYFPTTFTPITIVPIDTTATTQTTETTSKRETTTMIATNSSNAQQRQQ